MTAAPEMLRPVSQSAQLQRFLGLLCTLKVHEAGTEAARAYFADLFRGIDFNGCRVLDIGGGNGMHSYYAALHGASEVVCLEPEAAGKISSARDEFEQLRDAFPELPVRLDVRTVQDFDDTEGFDVVLMCDSINHLDEEACERLRRDPAARGRYHKAFLGIGMLSRPGAVLVVTDCARYNFLGSLGLTNPLCPSIEWHKHQQPETWASLLGECGFAQPRIDWTPLYRVGASTRKVLGTRWAAFFLKSMFRLEMHRMACLCSGRPGRLAPKMAQAA